MHPLRIGFSLMILLLASALAVGGGKIDPPATQPKLFASQEGSIPFPRSDFNGDGFNDIIFRNETTKDLSIWYMNGLNQIMEGATTPSKPADFAGWVLVGAYDFDGDNHPDLLWRNQVTGNLSIWFMTGSIRRAGATVTGISDLNWRVVATGKLAPDGFPHILWQNIVTGEIQIWSMNGAIHQATVFPSSQPMNPNLEVVGVAHMTGFPFDDIVWRNKTTSNLSVTAVSSDFEVLPPQMIVPAKPVDPNWVAVSVLDFDNDGDGEIDGDGDIIWQNQTTGKVVIWLMDGISRINGVFTNPDGPASLELKIVGPK